MKLPATIRWYTPSGKFSHIATTEADTYEDALALCRLAYPDLKVVCDEDQGAGFRFTVKGRNVCFVEPEFSGDW